MLSYKKVYCTVYDYNKTSIKFLKGANFETEGLLKKHRYFNNEYHDMHIMSINRDGVYELLKDKYKEYGKIIPCSLYLYHVLLK